MTPNEYLETEFRRYFPDSHVEATFHEDETIEVTIAAKLGDDPDYTFTMTIGSDDDWFIFSDGTMTLTVPLMPEAFQP